MKTELRFKVRSYECDSYHHVNNAVYLHYLEYARWEFLKDIGFDYNAMIKAGYAIYISHIDLRYKKSAFPDDELLIESKPIKKGAVSGVIEQKISRGNETIAEAKVSWAFVKANGQPTKIPKEFDLPGLLPEVHEMPS
ncbi:MAG: acyl-CoA thioesterase [Spirochaetaceae bacterium]|jgi:acyl-CoA thioester hydrolase|nr:acyl-CoA thioesterase [Spirochaetaceae bacterium]